MVGRHLFFAALAALSAGCGVDVDITGGESATCGGSVGYQIKLTNTTACPLASVASSESPFDFAFLPLVPADQLGENSILEEVCETANDAPSSGPAQGLWFVPMDMARDVLASAPTAALSATCTGPGVDCFDISDAPFGAPGVGCLLGGLAPNEMITLTCAAQVGSEIGSFFNPAIAGLIASGVCKAGPGQGDACFGGSDCGAGGACGNGICEGGSNDGNGCDTAATPSECPGGACTSCSSNQGFGIDCSQTEVEPCAAAAPATSPRGLAGMVAVLLAAGGLTLRRLRGNRRLT